MTIIRAMLVNRHIKKLLACQNLDSKKANGYSEKLIDNGKNSIQKLLSAIPASNDSQKKKLQYICNEILKETSSDLFFKEMDNDETNIRVAAKSVLFESEGVDAASLLEQLNEPGALIVQMVDVIEFQKNILSPEAIIKQAIKLTDKESSKRLFKIANELVDKFDIEKNTLDLTNINSPDKKLHLLEFLALIKHQTSAKLAASFLNDRNQMVKMAALKTLKTINKRFDVTPLFQQFAEMKNIEKQLAVPLILNLSKSNLVEKLAPILNFKDKEIQWVAAKMVSEKATAISFRRLLIAVENLEKRNKDAVISLLLEHTQGNLFALSLKLLADSDPFIKEVSEQFRKKSFDNANFKDMAHAALSDDKVIREKAIAILATSEQKQALKVLAKVFNKQPQSALSIVTAAGVLGYTKGLEIVIQGLSFNEFMVQRKALTVIRLLTSEKHAEDVQTVLLNKIPYIHLSLRNRTEEIIKELNLKFKLKPLPKNLAVLLKVDVLYA